MQIKINAGTAVDGRLIFFFIIMFLICPHSDSFIIKKTYGMI